MGAKSEQKQRTREAILSSAARLIRDKGIAGARGAEVMQGAGLTVGGFYAHFPTKEALVDAALRRTGAEMRERLFAGLEGRAPEERIELVLKRYLSAMHRDEVATGCPLPAVVGEVATTAEAHRPVLAEVVEQMVSELAQQLPPSEQASRRLRALGVLALMFGGLTLARALRGSALSEEVLRACRALARAALSGDPR